MAVAILAHTMMGQMVAPGVVVAVKAELVDLQALLGKGMTVVMGRMLLLMQVVVVVEQADRVQMLVVVALPLMVPMGWLLL